MVIMRTFKSGATRGEDKDKIDPEAALSPLVLQAYCEYIKKHRLQDDGKARGDGNWQLGISPTSYMKSLCRHFLEAWRGYRNNEPINDALFAIMFNTMGMLHERLKKNTTSKKLYTEAEYSDAYYTGYGDGAGSRATPTSSKTTQSPEEREEWLEFHENMRRSSLPNEDDYRDLQLQEQGGTVVPQYDPKTS